MPPVWTDLVGYTRMFFLRVCPIFRNAFEIVRWLISSSHSSAISLSCLYPCSLTKVRNFSQSLILLFCCDAFFCLGLTLPVSAQSWNHKLNARATDIEQKACLTLLETVQLNRLHDFLPEIITVSFGHWNGVDAIGTLIVYVLIFMAIPIIAFSLSKSLTSYKQNTQNKVANMFWVFT